MLELSIRAVDDRVSHFVASPVSFFNPPFLTRDEFNSGGRELWRLQFEGRVRSGRVATRIDSRQMALGDLRSCRTSAAPLQSCAQPLRCIRRSGDEGSSHQAFGIMRKKSARTTSEEAM
jgi:hypothetical protein